MLRSIRALSVRLGASRFRVRANRAGIVAVMPGCRGRLLPPRGAAREGFLPGPLCRNGVRERDENHRLYTSTYSDPGMIVPSLGVVPGGQLGLTAMEMKGNVSPMRNRLANLPVASVT